MIQPKILLAFQLCAASAIPVNAFAQKNTQKDTRPNLVFVFLDDVGWGALAQNQNEFTESELNKEYIAACVKDYTPAEAFQASKKAMPTLSWYCDEGVRFTNAYVTANVSAPSRAGMLTSAYQQRFGIYINPEAEIGVPAQLKMMPQILKEAGYTNGIFGKWHLSPIRGEQINEGGNHPLDRGFDEYYGFNLHGTTYYNSNIMYHNREKVTPKEFSTDEFTNAALNFIGNNAGKPKLIYLPYNAIHGPLGALAPEKYRSEFNYKSPTLNLYNSYMYAVDCGFKKIMEKLKELGEYDRTMVVFMSDNGAPGGIANVLPANGPFSGFKGQNYQGGFHVPMFIWYGNKILKGKTMEQMVSSMDVFPTFMDAAGVKLPKNQPVDGISLMPLITGKNIEPPHKQLVWMSQDALEWGMNKVLDQGIAEASYMVREGNYVLRYNVEGDKLFLHNYVADRAEKVNLISQFPEQVDRMKNTFKSWFSEMKTPLSWRKELWQNVQFWDKSLPAAPVIDRDKLRNKQDKTKSAVKTQSE